MDVGLAVRPSPFVCSQRMHLRLFEITDGEPERTKVDVRGIPDFGQLFSYARRGPQLLQVKISESELGFSGGVDLFDLARHTHCFIQAVSSSPPIASFYLPLPAKSMEISNDFAGS